MIATGLSLFLALGGAAPSSPDPDATAQWLLHGPKDGDPLNQRIEEISARFLGTAYVHSPLGEGEGAEVDPDPSIRFDAVDCLTFVEQTLALGLAPSPRQVEPLLQQLRYADEPSYVGRNHLMEAQWLPNNVRKGFLVDVTRKYGAAATVRVKKVLSRTAWASPSSKALGLPAEAQPEGTFELDMIPLSDVPKIARSIPTGTIMVIVRADLPTKVTRITHLGFVVQKRTRTWLRHAARSHYAKVIDEDLDTFLRRNSKYSKWPVVGVALFEARVPPPQADDVSMAGVSP